MKTDKKIISQLEWNLNRDKEALEYEMKKKMESQTCEYSGLPSVSSYEETKNSEDEILKRYSELTKGLH